MKMFTTNDSLVFVFDDWDGYRQSIRNAVAPLIVDQLKWRPSDHLRTVGELVRHIALGPIDWLLRMDAPGIQEAAGQIDAWAEDMHGNRYVVEEGVPIANNPEELNRWLEITDQIINQTLESMTVEDLSKTYDHNWRGNHYKISRQWTLWRIMAHDLHHGGELALMLGMQGIKNFELGDLGGHIIEPTLSI